MANEKWVTDKKILGYIRKVLSTDEGMKSAIALSHNRINSLEQAMEEVTKGSTPFGRATYNLASSIYGQMKN